MKASTNVTAPEKLVGRRIDRASLASLFNEGARLVTLLGPGGIGKTRLATAFAHEQISAYGAPGDGGVWFVDLLAAASAADLCAAIARTVGISLRSTTEESVVEHVGRALDRRGRLLLVLDNFESLVERAAAAMKALLRAAPRARFLVTSRVALGLVEEHRWPLQGLALPASLDDSSAEALRHVESIELFLQRAKQVRPHLIVDDEAIRSIATIASQLEGIPLAIELAAGRVSALSPAQLVERLSVSKEDVLVRSNEDGRHASMRTVVADSIRMLEATDVTTLVAAAVFDGGFALDAADAVIGNGTSVVASLERLVAHSLLRTTGSGTTRFAPYEVVREHASSELASKPEQLHALQSRHAEWYASTPKLESADLANVARAHGFLLGTAAKTLEGARQILQLAATLERLDVNGALATRLARLDRAVAIAREFPELESESNLRDALLARAHAHAELGAIDDAARDLRRVLEAASRVEDADTEALVHVRLGALVETRGNTEGARDHFSTALKHARGAREAEARAALAHTYRREGRLTEAEAEIVASIAIYRASGNREGLCGAIFEAGVLALFRQSYDAATTRFDEAEELARALDARQRAAAIMTARGTMEQERGNLHRGRELHEAAVRIFKDGGNVYSEASTLYYLGGAHLELGQTIDAETVFASALSLARAVGVPRYEALIQGARSAQHAIAGHVHEARALLDAADLAARACASERTVESTLAIHRLQLALHDRSAEEKESILIRAREIARSHPCDDPRFALRILLSAHSAPSASASRGLVVRAEGRGFQLEDTEVDLARRSTLARILHALARKRIDAPGETMRVEELLAAGWPDERVRYDAAANRVYVALAELRKLGLREWLVTDSAGYRLATSGPVLLETPVD